MDKHVVIINGSYHENGFTDFMLGIMEERLRDAGISFEIVLLRDVPIEFCRNCRHCTQAEGSVPGKCVIDDGMHLLIAKLEAADGYVFASPTNFGTVTALFKRFLERMVVYGYWPWEKPSPVYRKKETKVAVCVSSCAAPSIIGRFDFNTIKTLKMAAKNVGAKVVDTLLIGLISSDHTESVSERDRKRIEKTTQKLIDTL